MPTLVNTTPFVAGLDVLPDRSGVDTLHVTLKASFRLGPQLTVAATQAQLHSVDEYDGEPATSSLYRPGERHLACPGTAVLVVGSAHAPHQHAVTSLDVSLKIAGLHKVVRVHGDRRRKSGTVTAPEPFKTMPLVHARTAGGPEDPRNPIGVADNSDTLPNLEDPRHPGAPACFAPIPPHWSPRRDLAGTYDAEWRRRRAPYMPDDFDPNFFHPAPPDQILARQLVGGESLGMIHASPEPLQFLLPTVDWDLHATVAGSVHALVAQLERVVLAPDDSLLTLLWRATLPVNRRALAIEAVTVDLRNLRT